MNEEYPIVKYAKLIGKNTADFTRYDMIKFTNWWIKQPNEYNKKRELNMSNEEFTLEFSKNELIALKWAVERVLEDYDFKKRPNFEQMLKGIYKVLEEIE